MNRYRNADRKVEQRTQTTGRRPNEYTVFETKTRAKRHFRIKKRNLVFTAAAVFMALTIPIIFATAANTNEVEKMAQVSMQATQAVQTLSEQSAMPPAATDGNLISDLTDEAVVPSAMPSEPAPSAEPTATASDTALNTMTAYTVILPGTNDPFIAAIQQRLMDLNYMDQDDPTTLYGPATTQAIEYFQRKNGLPQDGIAGVETQTILFSGDAKPYTVSNGDSGPDVQSIQDRLVELGYTVDHTGYFGSDTSKAVKYFQRMNGLSSDGNVGSNTREILYSKSAEPSLEYTAAKEAAAAASASPSKSSDPGSSSSPKPSASASSSPKPSESSSGAPKDTSNVEAFINAALAQLGKTYVLGGKGPDVFDCSGLVYYALKASGNGIPYMTSYGWGDASQYTKISSMSDLKRGDVVCERGHVGIYLGDGQIVNASSSNGKIIISKDVFNSSYWVGHWVCGRRLF